MTLRREIDVINDWICPQINIGVYRCGFTKSHEAYNMAVAGVFDVLDKIKQIRSSILDKIKQIESLILE